MGQAIDYKADAPKASDATLERITGLATQQVELENEVESLEALLASKKEELKKLQTQTLPDAIREANLSEIRLANGYKIVVKDDYYANIKPENQDTAFKWLEENHYDDIIKNDVILNFKRGEDDIARGVMQSLQAMGMSDRMTNKRHIHWQTLRAFVKEQIEEGKEIPHEPFGIMIVPKATIKR